jgi:hypothetical protein
VLARCDPQCFLGISFPANFPADARWKCWNYQMLSLNAQRRSGGRRVAAKPPENTPARQKLPSPACLAAVPADSGAVFSAQSSHRYRRSDVDLRERSTAAPTSSEKVRSRLEHRPVALQPDAGAAVHAQSPRLAVARIDNGPDALEPPPTRHHGRESTKSDQGVHARSRRRASAMDQSKGGW